MKKRFNIYLKFIVSAILISFMFLNFSGCAAKTDASDPASSASIAATSTVPLSSYPVEIKDANGNVVTFNKKPVKIVSLTLTTDEILLSITSEANIAAISNVASDEGLSNVVSEAKKFPSVQGSEPEKIIALQPDVVFAADFTDAKTIKQLTDAGIKVYQFATPNSIDEVVQLIRNIAMITGDTGKGEDLIAWMNAKLDFVKSKVAGLSESQKLTAMSCDSFFYTYGKGTTFDDIAVHAGLIDLAAASGIQKWQQIQKEKIIVMNPDAIFLPSWSYPGFDAVKFVSDFKSDKSLSTVKAIKNNRVFSLPESHMTSVSQNIVLGVEDAARAAYPNLFK